MILRPPVLFFTNAGKRLIPNFMPIPSSVATFCFRAIRTFVFYSSKMRYLPWMLAEDRNACKIKNGRRILHHHPFSCISVRPRDTRRLSRLVISTACTCMLHLVHGGPPTQEGRHAAFTSRRYALARTACVNYPQTLSQEDTLRRGHLPAAEAAHHRRACCRREEQ